MLDPSAYESDTLSDPFSLGSIAYEAQTLVDLASCQAQPPLIQVFF